MTSASFCNIWFVRRVILAKRDEVSSTERLLDLIRDDNESEYPVSSLSSQMSISHRLKNFLNNPVSFKKTISVGVDLGHDDMKLVKINRISDKKFEILEFARIPFDPDITRENTQFYQY